MRVITRKGKTDHALRPRQHRGTVKTAAGNQPPNCGELVLDEHKLAPDVLYFGRRAGHSGGAMNRPPG
eukprot:5787662-Prorocentrum_lima.AAC.1